MSEPKSTRTLVKDIKGVLKNIQRGDHPEVTHTLIAQFGADVANKLAHLLTERGVHKERKEKVIYASEIGNPCVRKIWYRVNTHKLPPMREEPVSPWTLIKFLYGDILESLVLALVETAGHSVTDQQRVVEVPLPNGWKIRGKIDAVIDGVVMDVKSASTQGFRKFSSGALEKDDPFGYIGQLSTYVYGVTGKHIGEGGFLAIDKTLGKIVTDHYVVTQPSQEYYEDLVYKLELDVPPAIPPALLKADNQLSVNCSYCQYKFECYSHTCDGEGLHVGIYSTGPKYLTSLHGVRVDTLNYDEWMSMIAKEDNDE